MAEGWISLHRKFLNWEWFDDTNMVKLFIYLLLKANHKTDNWRGVNIDRGQLLTGLDSLHKETKISKQTLRTCLKRLENTSEINTQVTNKYRIITICNYDSYQDHQQATNKQTNTQLTSNQQATNKQLTANNNVNKDNNVNNVNNKGKRVNFIPPTIDQVKEYCLYRNNNVDAERFIDHYASNGWLVGKNKMKNWQAAVRTWEKSELNKGQIKPPLLSEKTIWKTTWD